MRMTWHMLMLPALSSISTSKGRCGRSRSVWDSWFTTLAIVGELVTDLGHRWRWSPRTLLGKLSGVLRERRRAGHSHNWLVDMPQPIVLTLPQRGQARRASVPDCSNMARTIADYDGAENAPPRCDPQGPRLACGWRPSHRLNVNRFMVRGRRRSATFRPFKLTFRSSVRGEDGCDTRVRSSPFFDPLCCRRT